LSPVLAMIAPGGARRSSCRTGPVEDGRTGGLRASFRTELAEREGISRRFALLFGLVVATAVTGMRFGKPKDGPQAAVAVLSLAQQTGIGCLGLGGVLPTQDRVEGYGT
jgi:hypothetical protein